MIIIHETNETGNIIRVITGIESDVMTKIHGVMVVDITPILSQLDSNKPVFLSIGRTESETQTIRMMHAVNAKPPFIAPLCVIDNNAGSKEKQDKGLDKPDTDKSSKASKSDHRVRISNGKCHLCGGTDTLITVDHELGICPACFKINAGLNKKAKNATKTSTK